MSVLPLPGVTLAPDRCPALSVQPLAPQVAGELAPLFKALGDPVRLRLLSLIASTTEICVCDLTDAFEVTGATISHHLRVLRESGMVDCERRGTWVYYWVRGEVLNLLGNLLVGNAGTRPEDGSEGVDPAPATGESRPASHQGELISPNPDVMRLLADPLRERLVRILAAGPATTSHLVAETGAKQPNVSGHLKLLREAGVVVAEPRGRFTYYRLVPDVLQGAALHLADLAAQASAHSDNFRNG